MNSVVNTELNRLYEMRTGINPHNKDMADDQVYESLLEDIYELETKHANIKEAIKSYSPLVFNEFGIVEREDD